MSYSQWYRDRRAANECTRCGLSIGEDGTTIYCGTCRQKKAARHKARIAENPSRERDRIRAYHADLKASLISAYGGKCACCGETRVEFLTLDHPNNDGKEHRRKFSNFVYADVRRRGFPPEYRMLCMNCNFSHGRYGYCPHERERDQAINSTSGIITAIPTILALGAAPAGL